MRQLKQLYTGCMNCENSNKQCPEIKKNIKNGYPPRGFYFENHNVDILVVGKNPGHILENEKENLLYKNKSKEELYKAWMDFRKKYYFSHKENKSRSSTFHKNLYGYLEYFIDKKEIFNHVAETNLIKCSTEDERGKLHKKTIKECYNKYLINEINFFKPKVILALGREVEKYLNKRNGIDFNCQIIYIKHPSYHYKKEEKAKALSKIKNQIKFAVKS